MIPKIAFLFLTVGNVCHESTWVKYFHGHEAYYSLYVHTKNALYANSFFASSTIQEKVPTTWANTMVAQVALLAEALKDPQNTKFVFASESTIPLLTFEEAYTRLLRHPYSEFPYAKNPNSERKFGELSNIYKNSQWIVVNRKHAQLMVNDKNYIKIFSQSPHDQEHYPSTLLAHHNLLEEVVGNPTSLVIWTQSDVSHPHLFRDLETDIYGSMVLEAAKKKEYLFARKFAQTCNLERLHSYIPQLY